MIPKQDRQGVRTARDIEQKYNLSPDFSKIEKVAADAKATATAANTRAREAIESVNALSKSTDTRFNEVNADISELGESVGIHSENIMNLDERVTEIEENGVGDGTPGEDGATFTPSVDNEGNLSWTNDKGLENPAPVNIKGKDGYTPVKGVDYFDGKDGEDGYTPVKGVDYFDGKDGEDGSPGASGVYVGSDEPTDETFNVWIDLNGEGRPTAGVEAMTIEQIRAICI